MNISYKIQLLIEEMQTTNKKHHKAYLKDIAKLEKFQREIEKKEKEITELKKQSEEYYNNIC